MAEEAGTTGNAREAWGDETTSTATAVQWPTIDGPLGVYHEEAERLAKKFYLAGFFVLPWLWFVNCLYFWPVLQQRGGAESLIRSYVVKSGVGFLVCTGVLLTWALMFAIGGDSLFGDSWRHLSVYDIADKYAPVW